MPRSRQQIEDLIDEVAIAYEKLFKESVPRISLLTFADTLYKEAQESFFRRRLGHLLPDDVTILLDALRPRQEPPPLVAIPSEPKNVVDIKQRGRPKKPGSA